MQTALWLIPIRSIAFIKFIGTHADYDKNDYTRTELAALIGQSRATEIFSRSCALTLPMIRKISKEWHVPAKVLIQEYDLTKR